MSSDINSEGDHDSNTDYDDGITLSDNFKMKLESASECNDSDRPGGDGVDLNMTVEMEGELENDPTFTENKIIIGKMKKRLTKRKIKKKKKKDRLHKNSSNGNTTSEEISSSDTDGEILILGDPRSGHLTHHNQYFKSFKFGTPILKDVKLPDITMPSGFGEDISVVTIKQEYEGEEDMSMAVPEVVLEEPEIKKEEEIKTKPKKLKNGFSMSDLAELNVRFVYACQMCQLPFEDPEFLKEHLLIHDQVGTYMCKTCDRVYQNIEDLRSHMVCHIKSGNFKCEDCNKMYHHSQSLMAHRKRWHTSERPHFCDICGRTYSLKNDLTAHMKSHSDDKHPCEYCDKAFRTDRYLRIHTKHVHLGHKYARIECNICNKSFQKKNLLTHKKLHEEKVHKCHYCGKCMTTSYSLVAHIRRHEGVKPFVCELCNKAFVDKGKLVRHIHSHKGTRDFQCDICEKSFSESQYLRQHKRTHDNSREYPCRVCGTKFKSMNSVWSHMRKHTHTNRYECHFCGKTCYRPDHLRSHLISHTGIKDFQCEICSKRFAKAYDLTEHRRGHSGERPYNCKLCNRAFARHGEFRKHKLSKYHREREREAGMSENAAGVENVPNAAFESLPLPRPHHCSPCDKRFTTPSRLAMHSKRKSHLAKSMQRHKTRKYHLEKLREVEAAQQTEDRAPQQNQLTSRVTSNTPSSNAIDSPIPLSTERPRVSPPIVLPFRNFHCTPCAKSFVTAGNFTLHCKRKSHMAKGLTPLLAGPVIPCVVSDSPDDNN